jgi:hypothetical protein
VPVRQKSKNNPMQRRMAVPEYLLGRLSPQAAVMCTHRRAEARAPYLSPHAGRGAAYGDAMCESDSRRREEKPDNHYGSR